MILGNRNFFQRVTLALNCIVGGSMVCVSLDTSTALGVETEQLVQKGISSERLSESWYLYLGGGLASVNYDQKTENDIDALRAETTQSKDSRITMHIDYLGFYWPVMDQRLLVGIIGTATADFWMGEGDDQNSVQVQQSYFNASGIYFLSDTKHTPFLRADLGIGGLTMHSRKGSDGEGRSSASDGFGIAGGGGYAWSVSKGTSLLVSILASHRTAGSRRITSTALACGVLL